jgi:hypothetical protein
MLQLLFKLSETRGKEAAGIAIRYRDNIFIHRYPYTASEYLKSKVYKELLDKIEPSKNGELDSIVCIAHSRMATNGRADANINNQPVYKNNMVVVHNGIICNVDDLWKQELDSSEQVELDTAVIPELFNKYINDSRSIEETLKTVYSKLKGATTTAIMFQNDPYLNLATNNGSLYFSHNKNNELLVFGSENAIIESFVEKFPQYQGDKIQKVEPNSQYTFDLQNYSVFFQRFDQNCQEVHILSDRAPHRVVDYNNINKKRTPKDLKRCSICILPETFPFISFDAKGMCNYCNNFKPHPKKGMDAFRQICDSHRKSDGSPDCIVAMSGGRDSSYGLHLIKKELGMNPIAYTYDWGMVTDLARRNISRICGQLGVEHVLVSADIRKKLLNVRKNVDAWLHNPELGIVPLFMAGDKQYFYYANQLAKKQNIPFIIFCANPDERTFFKSAYCGVRESNEQYFFNVSLANKVNMLLYYVKYCLKNPRILNSSFLDTIIAYYSAYFVKKDHYHLLYEYIPWDEKTIMNTLINEYDWEVATDTSTTWRIGDGTAAFYNYIYYKAVGFTEHDTLLSHQIRDKQISREQAMSLIFEHNKPRYQALHEYGKKIGFNIEIALDMIDRRFNDLVI